MDGSRHGQEQGSALPEPAAPTGRGRVRRPGRVAVVGVAVVSALAGLLAVASALSAGGTDLRGGRAVDSRDLVTRSAQRVAVQEAEVARVRQEVSDLTAQQGTGDALAASQQETAELAPGAGLTPVVGPGLTVTLDDAPRGGALPGNPSPDDLVVHQQDVQAVVNALWRGGASAVQVMDQRIVSTSAVRCVGNTLILQGRVYSPPFTVSAVGDTADLGRALDEDPQVALYREYVDLYGLGYVVQPEDRLTVPAFTGPLLPAYARVATGG